MGFVSPFVNTAQKAVPTMCYWYRRYTRLDKSSDKQYNVKIPTTHTSDSNEQCLIGSVSNEGGIITMWH